MIIGKVGDTMTFDDTDYKSKINAIRKYYKNEKKFLEVYFDNYNSFHIYIRIDYVKSDKCYKLRWFDLDYLKSSKINKYVGSEYLEDAFIDCLVQLGNNLSLPKENIPVGKDNNVYFHLNSKCKDGNSFKLEFYKYVPEIVCLDDFFEILFMALPKKVEPILEEVLGRNVSHIGYERKFRFDLFKDDLIQLFDDLIINRGENYFEEKKVIFLEKIDDRYFAVVNGNELYLVVIKYDEISHDLQVYCSCPCDFFCKHVYAVIKAIREKKFISFYKVMLKKKYEDMFDRLMDFDYSLSIGIVDDVMGVVNDNGQIEWVPVLDENGKSRWVVVEDDEKNKLVTLITDLMK